jgi:hypothetical protein
MNYKITLIDATIIDSADIRELAEILINLRHATKTWQVGYGSVLAERKRLWEAKADKWIKENII